MKTETKICVFAEVAPGAPRKMTCFTHGLDVFVVALTAIFDSVKADVLAAANPPAEYLIKINGYSNFNFYKMLGSLGDTPDNLEYILLSEMKMCVFAEFPADESQSATLPPYLEEEADTVGSRYRHAVYI